MNGTTAVVVLSRAEEQRVVQAALKCENVTFLSVEDYYGRVGGVLKTGTSPEIEAAVSARKLYDRGYLHSLYFEFQGNGPSGFNLRVAE